MFAHGKTVTVLQTVTTKDDYGDSTSTVTEVPWGPCAVAPRSSTEQTDPHRPSVIVGLSIYGPPTVEIGPNDQVRIGGELYDVEGEPGDWQSPFTGWHPGLEVAVKRAEA